MVSECSTNGHCLMINNQFDEYFIQLFSKFHFFILGIREISEQEIKNISQRNNENCREVIHPGTNTFELL